MKRSFLLKGGELRRFLRLVGSKGYANLITDEKHFLFSTVFENSELQVFSSGIVVYDQNDEFDTLIDEFLGEQQLDMQEFNPFKNKSSSNESSQNISTLPDSVYLDNIQIQQLLNQFRDDSLAVVSKRTDKRSAYQITYNEEILIINNNNTVYTPTGFTNFHRILEKVIADNSANQMDSTEIAISEFGLTSRIGPAIMTLVEIRRVDLVNLQLRGIKNIKIGRKRDLAAESKMIDEFLQFSQFRSVEPSQFQAMKGDYGQKLVIIRTDFLNIVEPKLIELTENLQEKIIISCTDQIKNSLSASIQDNALFVNLQLNQNGICYAAASINAKNIFEQWMMKKSKDLNLKLNRQTINNLEKNPETQDLFKFSIL
ncbi:MAG: hypothetical protein IH840_02300 [Candidatus Heimdallarchaeota archaeon]|nr:hypothetical protein [Candidatus Heimdallarchaeota archaeon]